MAPYAGLQPAAPAPDFLETLRKLWRHALLILACAAAIGAAAAAVVWRMPQHYTAEAKLLIGVPPPNALNVESIIAELSPTPERVENERYVIQSRPIAKEVADRLDLRNNPEFNSGLRPAFSWLSYLDLPHYLPGGFNLSERGKSRADRAPASSRESDAVVDSLLDHIDVSVLGRSHVLAIKATSESPDTAAAIANAVSEAYMQHERQDRIQTTNEVERFLSERIADLRKQVEESDNAVETYRRQHGLYRGASAEVTSQQLTELNTQLILAQTAKAEADARLKEASDLQRRGVEGDSVPDVLRSPLIMALKQQQAEAERKMAELSSTYGPRHPRIANAKGEIGGIRRKISLEVSRIIAGLRHEASTTDARYQALRQNFERLKNQMGVVNDSSIRLQALERDATVNRNLLESMLKRSKETVGQQQLATPNAKLVSSATPPEAPSFPPRMLLAFLGTLGGGMIGVLLALMRENTDRTFRRRDQIESAMGLPVLAMVPNLTGRTSPTAHVLRNPLSPYSEALRRIYIGLELSESERAPKTVMFCSALPSEGKSMLVASLGRLLASNGKRVLLIDCDWRCPSLHRPFRISNRSGLATLLSGERTELNKIVVNDALSGVDVIAAGNWEPQSVHLLSSERMRLALSAFAKNYDLVILDSPPVLVGAEVLSLARMVDKVVYTVRWGHTRCEAALEGLKQFAESKADVAGVVLSRVDPKRYRRYGYGNLNYEYARPTLTALG